jgi:bile acid-coenzyme A ligase
VVPSGRLDDRREVAELHADLVLQMVGATPRRSRSDKRHAPLREEDNVTIQGTPMGLVPARLAEADPDRRLITDDAGTITRQEFDLRTNRLARAYQALGVGQDSFVTIGLPNGREFFEAVVATWKLGATPQPISYRLPPIERQAIIGLADPSLVVGVDPSEVGGRPAVAAGFEPDASLSDDPLPPSVPASFKAPTSGGSTGRPKIIVATQPGVYEQAAPFGDLLRIPQDGVHLVTGPLYHNGPFTTALFALLKGNHIVVMPRFDAQRALSLIQEHRVDWMYAVPTMMHRIWRLDPEERERYDVSSLRCVFHMAAPCPPWLKEAWIDWLGGETILELYGGTEAMTITVITGDEWLAHRGSVGRCIVGELKILGPEGDELAPGEVGKIWMRRGEGAEPTYRYIGSETDQLEGGWECLGDLGWMDADGYVYISDRDTDMILVGGANVYPAEVEAALDEHPDVRSSCVIGLPDDEYGNLVHALVQSDAPLDESQLEAFLRERLVRYKIPRSYEFVTEPLRGDDGKVRRSALRAARVNA